MKKFQEYDVESRTLYIWEALGEPTESGVTSRLIGYVRDGEPQYYEVRP